MLEFRLEMLVLVAVMWWSVIVHARMKEVVKFRKVLYDQITNLVEVDLNAAESRSEVLRAFWRYDHFMSVLPSDMILKFWIPLKPELWWKNLSFLSPEGKKSDVNVEGDFLKENGIKF